ncbi:phospholipase C/P1 nuclease domain-containing protein [Paraphoma chrysanthemicola]|uniref:Phospholipase C/P1 nuclease domain-containing protein n=1 Tax=Paraphoma chrysanthemicola TaxID=798071 RepID=A0A8K0VYN4_9PLEO|nr:phospholipase C/P1 nuclease domain-containing protein [Paraphoma chrysanthemicola]
MTNLKLTVSLLAILPGYVDAWGSLGHTTVAYIAQNFVCEKTAKFAKQLLNDTSATYLANVATWADSYRYEKGGEFSSVYHYIDALDNPPESCNIDYERDCPEEGCIVSAIANYSSRAFRREIGIVEQQKALKWIIHFVGDIHQPLHVENIAVGGNLINVTFNGAKTNLHAIWDTAIPQKAIGNFSQATALSWAANLTSEIRHGQYKKESRTWLRGIDADDAVDSSLVWARDANKFVCSTVLPNGPDAVFAQELSGAYYEAAIPVVKKQIAKAGFRLAAWLDAIVEAADKHGHSKGHGKGNKLAKRGFNLEPWMEDARQARRDFGGDCGCGPEEHAH